MAGDELQLIGLRDDFYRDGYYKALIAVAVLLAAIALLTSVSIYLQVSKPDPVVFATGDEFRTLLPVPVNKPYVTTPDLIQWVSEVVPKGFRLDFINYNLQLKSVSQYYTENGWKSYLDILKVYADYNVILAGKLFKSATVGGAPFIVNQGLLPSGIYGWLVQMPLSIGNSNTGNINTNINTNPKIVIQALVVRIPTLNNLSGIAIDKLTVIKGASEETTSNG